MIMAYQKENERVLKCFDCGEEFIPELWEYEIGISNVPDSPEFTQTSYKFYCPNCGGIIVLYSYSKKSNVGYHD